MSISSVKAESGVKFRNSPLECVWKNGLEQVGVWRNGTEYCLRGRGPVQDVRGSKEAQRLLPWLALFGLSFFKVSFKNRKENRCLRGGVRMGTT